VSRSRETKGIPGTDPGRECVRGLIEVRCVEIRTIEAAWAPGGGCPWGAPQRLAFAHRARAARLAASLRSRFVALLCRARAARRADPARSPAVSLRFRINPPFRP